MTTPHHDTFTHRSGNDADSVLPQFPTQEFSTEKFTSRHLGLTEDDRAEMLRVIGYDSVESLLDATVPASIRMRMPIAIPSATSEHEVLSELRTLFSNDIKRHSFIGQGYYNTITPPVVKRNVLENPSWYTAYTPYQPEISQGRLEALLNYQTMICEITGLPMANASLLDEATAVAEAVAMAHRLTKSEARSVFVDANTHPQTINVLRTRMNPIGLTITTAQLSEYKASEHFAVVISYPGSDGNVLSLSDVRKIITDAHDANTLAIAVTDLLACTILVPPGQLDFDIAVGSSQRFGVPMAYGGPHAAFLTTRESFARALPGRLVGVSTDTAGRPALRLALQTREQHIRRDKATSNICTSQVLLANIAGMYAVWHGRDGLRHIATRIHRLACAAMTILARNRFSVVHAHFFDTVAFDSPQAEQLWKQAQERGLNLRLHSPTRVSFSLDEATTPQLLADLLSAIGVPSSVDDICSEMYDALNSEQLRHDEFMTQNVFQRYHSEHEMLRYLKRLSDKDLALDRTMIPLGSCTMKLNATTEMEPITWPEIAHLHPFAPEDESVGIRTLIDQLENMLVAVTGYSAVSLQPNAGSQGEFAGLLAIRGYHLSRGDTQRTVCLIPSSAHGTNAASAVMAGMEVRVVTCDEDGNVDMADLTAKAQEHSDRLAALMITYPSTHGVFEEDVVAMCDVVHQHGGQVYVDGANLNALVGVAQPGKFGADVSHLNLHKTFCIPHGGGGPGVGPVAVREHLAPFLPGNPLVTAQGPTETGPVSAANYGSAGILPIPWVYIRLMGPDGLLRATSDAILSANYIAKRLDSAYPTLYSGRNATIAHECLLDFAHITKTTGVTVEDIAKRLMDYGFHAPTMSFPVANTLMVEPTESESLAELNRFCDAMLKIRSEIDEVRDGHVALEESVLRHAPHTVEDMANGWTHHYSMNQALYPLPALRGRTYFVPVSRIDAAHGDRHLVCSCAPIEEYEKSLLTATVSA
jgi:glycine dehydrogenase